MESALQPPTPFLFENNLTNVTSGNLSADWEKWKKAFNIYFEACELSKKSSKVQINILLHVIGDKCREVYEQFKEEPATVTDLLKKFDDFFIPKKNLAIERHKFFKRQQQELESTEQYLFELNKIASKCDFKDLRDDLLCSRFICGVNDVGLSERMLREPKITLEKALEICKLAEMSRMQAQSLKTDNYNNQNVYEISQENYVQEAGHSDVHLVKQRRSADRMRRRPPVTPTRSGASGDGGQHSYRNNINQTSYPMRSYNNNVPIRRSGPGPSWIQGNAACLRSTLFGNDAVGGITATMYIVDRYGAEVKNYVAFNKTP
ncbi:hypothetical protein NE865_06916 [Phthorimaea operculella]|nr:hypothetical protein NE865_06916 [Phthorimaea operculella]